VQVTGSSDSKHKTLTDPGVLTTLDDDSMESHIVRNPTDRLPRGGEGPFLDSLRPRNDSHKATASGGGKLCK